MIKREELRGEACEGWPPVRRETRDLTLGTCPAVDLPELVLDFVRLFVGRGTGREDTCMPMGMLSSLAVSEIVSRSCFSVRGDPRWVHYCGGAAALSGPHYRYHSFSVVLRQHHKMMEMMSKASQVSVTHLQSAMSMGRICRSR